MATTAVSYKVVDHLALLEITIPSRGRLVCSGRDSSPFNVDKCLLASYFFGSFPHDNHVYNNHELSCTSLLYSFLDWLAFDCDSLTKQRQGLVHSLNISSVVLKIMSPSQEVGGVTPFSSNKHQEMLPSMHLSCKLSLVVWFGRNKNKTGKLLCDSLLETPFQVSRRDPWTLYYTWYAILLI